MKHIVSLIVFVLLSASASFADTCSKYLTGPAFSAGQATVLCKAFGTAIGLPLSQSFVPTMAATPVAGTNYFAPGLNVVPTAAANTAAFLGLATPVVGQQFSINNASGVSVRAKASAGLTLNGATAGGYIVIPNLATLDCETVSLTNQVCRQPVIPTPAGP